MTDPFYKKVANGVRKETYKSPAVVMVVFDQYVNPMVITDVEGMKEITAIDEAISALQASIKALEVAKMPDDGC